MSAPSRSQTGNGPLGIISGGGALPFAVADAVLRSGREVVLFPIAGAADANRVASYPHRWVKLGQFGRFRRLAADAKCRDLVFIGNLIRPALSSILLDVSTLRVLPRVAAAMRGGDDRLLTGVGQIFEAYGFRLLGAYEVAPDILVAEGPVGRRTPSGGELSDIRTALALLDAIGPFDVGQAAVVVGHRVVAIEGAEGTDAMLARVAEMRRTGRLRTPIGAGVLVKAAKPGQDHRFDLPSIGPQTVAGAAHAGLSGIAVVAGEVLIAEPQRVQAAADRAGLFVLGVRRESS